MSSGYRTIKNWKNFCSLVVYELGKKFDIEKETDIKIVKTSIGDGMGIGIKFDSDLVKSSIHCINSVIDKLTKGLKGTGIEITTKWGYFCDESYVDTTITESSGDEPLVLVLCISGDLESVKVPLVNYNNIKVLGKTYLCCYDNLCDDVEYIFDEKF